MATPAAPRSTSAARVACKSIGPGVVRFPASLSTGFPAGSNAPRVPIAPIGHSALNTCRARMTDVVLPFVPVTPIICSRAAGRRYHASAATAAARRPLRTRTCGMATGCRTSTTAAAAPRRIGDEVVAVEHRPANGAEQHATVEPPRVGGEAGDFRHATDARVRRIDQDAGARQRVHHLLQRSTHGCDTEGERGSANTVTVVPGVACSPAAGHVW